MQAHRERESDGRFGLLVNAAESLLQIWPRNQSTMSHHRTARIGYDAQTFSEYFAAIA